jgi:hypothetical protein
MDQLVTFFVTQPLSPAIPIDENQVHRELVREENIHEKKRRQVENDSEAEYPPAHSPPENCEWKQQFPKQHESDCERQVRLQLRQPEGEFEMCVVQVVE